MPAKKLPNIDGREECEYMRTLKIALISSLAVVGSATRTNVDDRLKKLEAKVSSVANLRYGRYLPEAPIDLEKVCAASNEPWCGVLSLSITSCCHPLTLCLTLACSCLVDMHSICTRVGVWTRSCARSSRRRFA